ncbi:MAG: serine/threonine protein kinase [Wenzhouxiangella sp.]|nr:MAG: serine/threonine protein kinase [Wenzhouxiangella sp.]
MSSAQRPFEGLDPSLICDAVESLGLVTDGRLLALNSYENRVWQVGIESGEPLIAKFYRPDRWSDQAIAEEHEFALELAGHGLSVVAPLKFDGQTLHRHQAFRFALFPRRGGHAPELAHRPTLEALGRVLGRMHAVGASGRFDHRRTLSIAEHGRAPVSYLLSNDWLPAHLQTGFESLATYLLEAIDATWPRAGKYQAIRLHGDCHPGNILWRDDTAHFVDLDDCLTGPAIQDMWMLISGEPDERAAQIGWLLNGYRMFHDFNPAELNLIEPLRCLRMLHHQAWLARRWEDPAFPLAFPWFTDARHWENVMQQLREQLDELQQPPLQLPQY